MKRNDFAVRTLESAEVRGEQCQRHGKGQVTETVCKHCHTHGLSLDSVRFVYVELCPERYDGVRRGTAAPKSEEVGEEGAAGGVFAA